MLGEDLAPNEIFPGACSLDQHKGCLQSDLFCPITHSFTNGNESDDDKQKSPVESFTMSRRERRRRWRFAPSARWLTAATEHIIIIIIEWPQPVAQAATDPEGHSTHNHQDQNTARHTRL